MWWQSPKFISSISLLTFIGMHALSAALIDNYEIIPNENNQIIVSLAYKAWFQKNTIKQ